MAKTWFDDVVASLELTGGERVLEVGPGPGFSAWRSHGGCPTGGSSCSTCSARCSTKHGLAGPCGETGWAGDISRDVSRPRPVERADIA
jgi:hypothetical protein